MSVVAHAVAQNMARTAFEIKRKHIQAKANAAELLNPRKTVLEKMPGSMPICTWHCRFLPEKLIKRPIATSLLPVSP
ncbi:hypothetical protein NE850_25820 [Paraburkholderia sp. USG1]|uniref:hypothetical protein n=1 Tax=Paraburkholderia sp. USG1 TaxID=2952268 RepID=UPI00285C24B6|nr:hypothetical protein [Paraburkholderia sp. USG1]MDR8399730.1 hypothetical protein [Paraburkholderia sp. USG1]